MFSTVKNQQKTLKTNYDLNVNINYEIAFVLRILRIKSIMLKLLFNYITLTN